MKKVPVLGIDQVLMQQTVSFVETEDDDETDYCFPYKPEVLVALIAKAKINGVI